MVFLYNKFPFSYLFLSLLWPSLGTTQSMNFISGYSFSIPEFDHLNDAFTQSEEIYDWDIQSFKEIRNMHGALFGIRYRTDAGFFGINYEHKLKSLEAERSTEGRDHSERWSLTYNSIQAETAFTLGPFSAGIGLNSNFFSTKLDASFNPENIKLLKDHSFGTHFFLEVAIGKPSNIQLTIRPFYHMMYSDLNYANLTYLISGLQPGVQESRDLWGFSVLIINGPK